MEKMAAPVEVRNRTRATFTLPWDTTLNRRSVYSSFWVGDRLL